MPTVTDTRYDWGGANDCAFGLWDHFEFLLNELYLTGFSFPFRPFKPVKP